MNRSEFNKSLVEGRTARLLLDIVFVTIVLLIGWRLIRSIAIKVLLTIFIIWAFVPYWLIGSSVEELTADGNGGYEGVLIKNSLLLKHSMPKNMTVSTTTFLSGIMQLYNKMFGDDKFKVSKQIILGHVSSYCPLVEISAKPFNPLPGNVARNLYQIPSSNLLPEKFFIMTQHVPSLIDIFTFLNFVPEGYRMRVVHDVSLNSTVKKIFERIFLNPLYGAVIIDKNNKEVMKLAFETLALEMIQSPEPMAVVFWPSGRVWNKKYPNGTKQFNPGGFILSAFTGFPSCVVHSRLINNETRLVSRRSSFVYPPNDLSDPPTADYQSFVEKCRTGNLKSPLEEYRRRVETVYRVMDNEIENL